MSRPDVIRAWKDAEYRASLSATEIEMLPAHPAGLIEISDTDLGGVAGGSDTLILTWPSLTCTLIGCDTVTVTVCTITICIPPIPPG